MGILKQKRNREIQYENNVFLYPSKTEMLSLYVRLLFENNVFCILLKPQKEDCCASLLFCVQNAEKTVGILDNILRIIPDQIRLFSPYYNREEFLSSFLGGFGVFHGGKTSVWCLSFMP